MAKTIDKVLAKLAEHTEAARKEAEDEAARKETQKSLDDQTQGSPSSGSMSLSGNDSSTSTAPTTRPDSTASKESTTKDKTTQDEILRLKLELAQAQNKISRLDQELQQRRAAEAAGGRITPSLGDPDFLPPVAPLVSPAGSRIVSGTAMNAPGRVPFVREASWPNPDDARSDTSETMSTGGLNRARGIWNNNTSKAPFGNPFPQGPMANDGPQAGPWGNPRNVTPNYDPAFAGPSASMELYRPDRMLPPEATEMMRPSGRRGNRFDSRYGSMNAGYGYGGYNMGPGPFDAGPGYAAGAQGPMGASMYPPYQQQPVGSALSPHATEFTSAAGSWKTADGQTYISPTTEPLNYRRLLDRNVTCDWKYIVDKIVCNNDQQASIFLQQKLKVSTPEQKYDIVEAIVAQAYPLMVNRFGNFLVQRCFEHGTPEQVIKIAEAIRGNTLNLSMDPFGCHVVQKAFDCVPEDYKAIMVHELLRRIPETVIHRYACHVWQKLFELRWTESPPQIMKYVNEALRGMWHEVALGETGSLVVQNIFENCLEEDKV